MKILQINCVYGYGSTGKITEAIHTSLLKKGDSSIVLYGRGAESSAPGVLRVCSDIYGKSCAAISHLTGLRYGGCRYSTNRILHIIQQEQPDVVHLQCINGNFVNVYRLVSWLNLNKITTVLTHQAEFMYTANCSHAFDCEQWKFGCMNCANYRRASRSLIRNRTHQSWERMKQAFSGFSDRLCVVSVSPWLKERAAASPILRDCVHCVVGNGLDTNIFCYRPSLYLRQKHNLCGKRVVFHATAMFSDQPDHPKGGWHLLQLARKMRKESVAFLVAGKTDIHSSLPENVILLGEIQDQSLLAGYYNMADLVLLTSQRETFSMVCAESLCCGTPVVGYCAGAPEKIALPDYSQFVPYGDIDALEQTIHEWISKKTEDFRADMIREACHTYSQDTMTTQYYEIYRRMICKK